MVFRYKNILNSCNQCSSCCRESRCLFFPKDIFRLCKKLKIQLEYLLWNCFEIYYYKYQQCYYITSKLVNNECYFLNQKTNLCLIHNYKSKNAKYYKCYKGLKKPFDYWIIEKNQKRKIKKIKYFLKVLDLNIIN